MLGAPTAFVLSQDQTLCKWYHYRVYSVIISKKVSRSLPSVRLLFRIRVDSFQASRSLTFAHCLIFKIHRRHSPLRQLSYLTTLPGLCQPLSPETDRLSRAVLRYYIISLPLVSRAIFRFSVFTRFPAKFSILFAHFSQNCASARITAAFRRRIIPTIKKGAVKPCFPKSTSCGSSSCC